MKTITLGLFSVFIAFGATQKEPPNCATRPCTYTITCADSMCRPGEVDEVQAALDDAYRGDKIKLEAGRFFPSNGSLVITKRPGTSDYLTITTTAEGKLPDPNARITPAYREILPTILATGPWALGIAGNNTPAEYIRIAGLRFSVAVNVNGQGPLLIGNSGSVFGTSLTSPAQQPDNIIVDQCLFEQDFSYIVRRMMTINGRRVTLRNSYIDGIRELNADTQAINAVQGVGPLSIENCYIGGATENLLLGGVGTFFDGAIEGAIRYNYFPRVEERMRFSAWDGGMVVFKGRVIRPSTHTNNSYVARNGGITGNTEPLWPVNVGETVEDNGIVWACVSNSNAHLAAKNNLEIKSARRMQIQYNVFARHWIDGQDNNVVFKLSNCVQGTSNCQCVPEFSGSVNVNGTSVSTADGKPLPSLHQPEAAYNVDPLNININSVDYKIASFEPFTLQSDAGLLTGAAYTFGQKGCRSAWDTNMTFSNNIIRGGPTALTIAQWTNGVKGQIGNITVRDNLMEDIDCQKWGTVSGNCGNTKNYIFLGTLPTGIELNHNTIFGRNAALAGIHFEGRRELHEGDGRLLNNIFPRGAQMGIQGGPNGDGSVSLDSILCGGKPCPTSQYDKNIIAGADLSKYNTGATYNLCPSNGRCAINWDFDHPQYGKLFDDFGRGVYRVREGHFAKRAGTDGKDLGADYDQLPQIRNLRIETTDRLALFKYDVTQPIQQIPCVVEVSENRDLSTTIRDLNGNFFFRPGSDRQTDSIVAGLARTIRIGRNLPLSPNTVYWYRLHCGGDAAEGSFTTKSTMSGRQDVSLQASPSSIAGVSSVIVEYSNNYDRSTDSLVGPSYTSRTTCATGASCQVRFSTDSGNATYYRVLYLDQSNNVIDRSQMQVSTNPGVEVPPAPKFVSSGALNSASFVEGAVAPCQLISFFGTNLGPDVPVSLQLTPDGKAVTNVLAETRVLFDRQPAPLLFVSSSQINAVVPAAVAQKRLTEVQLEYKGQLSDPVVLPVAAARPGIFTGPGGQGLVLHWPDYSANSSGNPAAKGGTIMVFGTSGGPTVPACQDGVIVKEPRYLQLPITASIGGVSAPVTFAGSAPDLVTGVMQFNVQIPDGAPTGDAVPLLISIGGSQSQDGVTIAVR